jgi:hypothetical protein
MNHNKYVSFCKSFRPKMVMKKIKIKIFSQRKWGGYKICIQNIP